MSEPIRIKPHHFVDIVTAFGAGSTRFEPHPYGHAVHKVAATVAEDPDALLEIDFGADDICAPCVHNVDGLCDDTIDTSYRAGAPDSKREWNLLLDRRWALRLGLSEGDRLTAREFCERLRDGTDDITDIYPETPAERTAVRAANLKRGVSMVLAAAVRLENVDDD
ncbi:MAG: hypothetical protein KAX19_07235 [Candidatus Brocadiae bacterium]|nr:hypothetical protein [Candidatus Brocadiia bacterium]